MGGQGGAWVSWAWAGAATAANRWAAATAVWVRRQRGPGSQGLEWKAGGGPLLRLQQGRRGRGRRQGALARSRQGGGALALAAGRGWRGGSGGSCGERTSWGTARAGWAPAPGWARGEEGDAVCRHRGPMVLNRVDHDALGCLGRWVGGHRSPGAARPAGRRATAATAAAAAAAQVRASQGQPVCTAQESTWWYPLPAKARAV